MMPREPNRGFDWLPAGLDILFPPVCAICSRIYQPAAAYAGICRQCLATLALRFGYQQRLAWPQAQIEGGPSSSEIFCAGYYQGALRRALINLKFADAPEKAAALAGLLVRLLSHAERQYRAVLAVPLHRNRLRERGYNQAGLLAEQVGSGLHIPDFSDCLLRVKATQRQSAQQGREERLANLAGAFCLDNRHAGFRQICQPGERNRNILLVDDILTTGATLTAAAIPLWQAGYRVTGLVVASGQSAPSERAAPADKLPPVN